MEIRDNQFKKVRKDDYFDSLRVTSLIVDGTDISTVNSQVTENTADIATNTFNIAINAANIATNTANITTNTIDIASLQADLDGFPDELKNLTTAEIQQLENIGTSTISSTQWGYLGAQDQAVATTSDPTFGNLTLTSVNFGASALNVYDASTTLVSEWTGLWDGANQPAVTLTFTKVGRLVNVTFTYEGKAGNSTTGPIILADAIPIGFRPSADMKFGPLAEAVDNGTSKNGYVKFESTDNKFYVYLSVSYAGSTFTGGTGTCGVGISSITYIV